MYYTMDGAFSHLPLRQRAWIAAVFGASVTYVFSWIVRFPGHAVAAQSTAYMRWLGRTHGTPRLAIPVACVIAGHLLILSASIAGGYAVAWFFRTPRSVRWALAAPLVCGAFNLTIGQMQSQMALRNLIRHGAHLSAASITGLNWEMVLVELVACLLAILFTWAGWAWGYRRSRRSFSPVPAAE
jgi:hypothetical protein